jgi:hypothetical protein
MDPRHFQVLGAAVLSAPKVRQGPTSLIVAQASCGGEKVVMVNAGTAKAGIIMAGECRKSGFTTNNCYDPQPYARFASICQSIHVCVSPILVLFEPATFVYLFS